MTSDSLDRDSYLVDRSLLPSEIAYSDVGVVDDGDVVPPMIMSDPFSDSSSSW